MCVGEGLVSEGKSEKWSKKVIKRGGPLGQARSNNGSPGRGAKPDIL